MTAPLLPDPPPPLPPLDDLSARLQARVESFEAHPEAPRSARRVQAAPAVQVQSPEEGVADLNEQLDLLREQLETAFDEMNARIRAAEVRADEADTRAQVASARAANVLEAVDKLAGELARLAEHSTGDEQRLLRSAVERLRLRLTAG
jgi:hypothetical protein